MKNTKPQFRISVIQLKILEAFGFYSRKLLNCILKVMSGVNLFHVYPQFHAQRARHRQNELWSGVDVQRYDNPVDSQ